MMRELRVGDIHAGSPTVHRNLRQAVLPILVLGLDGKLDPIGTAFVVSCTGKEAMALTARHVVEHAIHLDGVRPLSHPSSPFQFSNFSTEPKNTKLHVLLMLPSGEFIPCSLAKAWFQRNGPDIAPILLRIPERYDATFTYRLGLHSRGPQVGDKVAVFGYSGMATGAHFQDGEGITFKQDLNVPLKSYGCEVAKCFGMGEHRLIKWPCFQTTMTSDPGMSGGPIVFDRDGSLVACGVVSSGSTFAPEGIGSKIYPALTTTIDAAFAEKPTLLDCIRLRMIDDESKGHLHVLKTGQWVDNDLFYAEGFVEAIPSSLRGVVIDASNLPEIVPQWVSDECLALGRIQAGDSAYVFLISKEFHSAVKGPVSFVKAEAPYIWLECGSRTFRFFVFEVKVEDDVSVKVLTDLHEEAA